MRSIARSTRSDVAQGELARIRLSKSQRSPVAGLLCRTLRYYFESVRGFRYDTVRAVVAAGADQPADALARAEAMEALAGRRGF